MEQEKLSVIIELYKNMIKFKYNIFHNTYVPAKTEGIVSINKSRGTNHVGAVSLIFLTYNAHRNRRHPSKRSTRSGRSIASFTPPKDLFQEKLYTVFFALKLRIEFYVSILQGLAMNGETVYNVFGGSKFMYASMVSHVPTLFTNARS